MNRINATIILATTITAAGCSNDPAEQDFAHVTMNLTVSGTGSESSEDAGSSEAALQVEHAEAFIRHIEFYLPEGQCAHGDADAPDSGTDDDGECEDKIRIEGPWVVDLMTGEATPDLDGLKVPVGEYRRIDIRFEDAGKKQAREIEIPAELMGLSLRADGAYSGEAAENFELRLTFNNDVRFESKAGIELTAEEPQTLFAQLDVQSWFDRVELDECFRKDRLDVVDGTLQILDEGRRCSDVENAIKREMKHGGRLDKKAPR